MNFIDEMTKQVGKDLDNTIFKFLNNNGYEIDNITNKKRLDEIIQELKEMDLFIDYVKYVVPYEIETTHEIKITTLIYPFFNYISNPINKYEILKILKEKYDRGELGDVRS